jgi:hypothetical protein
MIVRRMSSRRVGLTAAFLALAAGGAAACDAPEPEHPGSEVPVYSGIEPDDVQAAEAVTLARVRG